jgi:hypothetical protein
MKKAIAIALIAITLPVPSSSQRGALQGGFPSGVRGDGTWSALAYALPQYWDDGDKPFEIKSPDGLKRFCMRGEVAGKRYPEETWRPAFFVTEKGKKLQGRIQVDGSPELIWADDSKSFVITSSAGGLVGWWGAMVYRLSSETLEGVDVTKDVRINLARRLPVCTGEKAGCSDLEKKKFAANLDWVNVIAIAWEHGSDQLALLAGVPNSSRYGENMGKEIGYLVDVPSGHILQTFTRAEFAKKWHTAMNH